MNVIHLIPRFPYFGKDTVAGGAASALFNLVKEQRRTHTVRVMAQVPEEGIASMTQFANLDFVPLGIRCPPSSIGFGLEYAARVVFAARKRRNTCDVVHGHSGYLDYAVATMAVASIMRVPAVHTLYCPVSLTDTTYPYPGRTALLQFAASQIDMFVAISENVARSLHRAGIPVRKVRVIPPAVNTQSFLTSYERQEARSHLGIPADAPVVLFVGSTERVKNEETVLDAMSLVIRRIPSSVLVVTTELQHPEHQAREAFLAQRIEELGLAQHVIKLGIIDNMPELMAACSVLVAPFLNTDGPSDYFMAVLEAMAVGRPVIASAVGGMPEVVDNTVGYLVRPRDSEGIASILIDLLQDGDKRTKMGSAAQSRVQRLFHPELVAKLVDTVYEEVLRGE